MSLDFSHLELYFVYYSAKFTKPADPLVLFVHWSMIQHRFRCCNESEVIEKLFYLFDFLKKQFKATSHTSPKLAIW